MSFWCCYGVFFILSGIYKAIFYFILYSPTKIIIYVVVIAYKTNCLIIRLHLLSLKAYRIFFVGRFTPTDS
jgi:hypothetical protein